MVKSLRDIVFANLNTQDEMEFWKEFVQVRKSIFYIYVDYETKEVFFPLKMYGWPSRFLVVNKNDKEADIELTKEGRRAGRSWRWSYPYGEIVFSPEDGSYSFEKAIET